MRSILFAMAMLVSCAVFSQKKKALKKEAIVTADSLFMAANYAAAIPQYLVALKQPMPETNAQPWFRLGFSYHRLGKLKATVWSSVASTSDAKTLVSRPTLP
jgi:hypothetical protein